MEVGMGWLLTICRKNPMHLPDRDQSSDTVSKASLSSAL